VPTDPEAWLHASPEGAVVRVHVVPGARRAGVAGLYGAALRVRVTAPPVEGAANRELLGLLAGLLGVRASDLVLESGSRGREKRVRVRGVPAETVRERLAPALSVDRAKAHN
jgi:uncharacterized protein (TIGR00251 family)